MREFKFKTDKHEYTFICDCNTNARGFIHTANMFLNGQNITGTSAQYYNRTWEPWTYCSVIKSCVYNLLDIREQQLTNEFKRINNWNRLTAKRRDALKTYIDTDIDIIEYKNLLQAIKRY